MAEILLKAKNRWMDRALAAERTVKSLSVMLGWENVPPQDTLEQNINALKARAGAAAQASRLASDQEPRERTA